MNSSKERSSHALADLDEFLRTFVNDLDYAGKKFPDLMPPALEFGAAKTLARIKPILGLPPGPGGELRPLPKTLSDPEVIEIELGLYQHFMRSAWLAPTDGQRRYWTFKLRQKLYDGLEQLSRDSVPRTICRVAKGKWKRVAPWKPEYADQVRDFPDTPFGQALNRLEHLASLTKRCGNADCPAPFFIAKRKSQRYCSDGCAAVFQQEAKRKWWQEHGNEWRERRLHNRQGGTSRDKAKRKSRGKAKRK